MSESTIYALIEEVKSLESVDPDAIRADALRALASELPGKLWRHRQTGWRRTHYADGNANGVCGPTYADHADAIAVAPIVVARTGGQNDGEYALDDGGLYCCDDGCLVSAEGVDGGWSQWQGSSSAWQVTSWRAVAATEDRYQRAVAEIIERLTAYRDQLRMRHSAGAAHASRLLAALAAEKN